MTCHERRSLFLSAGAFVLSACALLNSVNHTTSAPSIVSEAPPPEKPLAESDGYVRLQQLAVEQVRSVGPVISPAPGAFSGALTVLIESCAGQPCGRGCRHA